MSCSFEKVRSCPALCGGGGGGGGRCVRSRDAAVGGCLPVADRGPPEAAVYLASDSRTPIGGEPSGDLPSNLSAFVREGGRWAESGGRGFELK